MPRKLACVSYSPPRPMLSKSKSISGSFTSLSRSSRNARTAGASRSDPSLAWIVRCTVASQPFSLYTCQTCCSVAAISLLLQVVAVADVDENAIEMIPTHNRQMDYIEGIMGVHTQSITLHGQQVLRCAGGVSLTSAATRAPTTLSSLATRAPSRCRQALARRAAGAASSSAAGQAPLRS